MELRDVKPAQFTELDFTVKFWLLVQNTLGVGGRNRVIEVFWKIFSLFLAGNGWL